MGLFGGNTSKVKEVIRDAKRPIQEGLELADVYKGIIPNDKGMGFLAQYMALEETAEKLLTKSTKVQLQRYTADAETYRMNVYKTIADALPESEGKVIREAGISRRNVPPRVITAEKALGEAKKGLAKVHEHKDIFYIMDFSTLLIEYNMVLTRCNEVITGRPTVLDANTLVKEAQKYIKDVDKAVAAAKERVAKVPMDKDPKLAGDSKYLPLDTTAPADWQETSESLVSKAAETANKALTLIKQNSKLLGSDKSNELAERYQQIAKRGQSILELKENATEGGKRLVGDSICFIALVQKAIADAKREHMERTGQIKKPVKYEVEASTGVQQLDQALYIVYRAQVQNILEAEEETKFRARIEELKEKKDGKEAKQLLNDVVLASGKAFRSKLTGSKPEAKVNGNGNGAEATNVTEELAASVASTSTAPKSSGPPKRPPIATVKDREETAALILIDALVLLDIFKPKLPKSDLEKFEKIAAGLEKEFPNSRDEKAYAKDARAFKESVQSAIDKPRKEAIQRVIDEGIKKLTSKFTFYEAPVHLMPQAQPSTSAPQTAPAASPVVATSA